MILAPFVPRGLSFPLYALRAPRTPGEGRQNPLINKGLGRYCAYGTLYLSVIDAPELES